MKATGIVRKVDELGRIVLPIELRRTQGIKEGDPLEIYVEDKAIVLKKYEHGCTYCGSVENVANVDGIKVCRECAEKIYREFKEVVVRRGAK